MLSSKEGQQTLSLCRSEQTRHHFSPPGRLGPMVTCTLKLGISILNGGNVQVQQVRLYLSRGQLLVLSLSVNQWVRLAFSRLSPTCHYLENAWLPEREKRCRLLQESLRTDAVLQVPFYQVDRNGKRKYCLGITCFNLYISFCPLVSWIWMRLRDRTKQKDLAWWQRRVHVSWDTSASTSMCFI